MHFADRIEAGQKLAQALIRYKGQPVQVYALPRGGAQVAREVARVLNAPLDLILVRKIGAPAQPELAIGAVVDGGAPAIVRNNEGATMRAALQATRMRHPQKLVLAVPIGARDSIEALRNEVDEVVCLSAPEDFGALGYYYEDFRQLSDQDVIDILKQGSSASIVSL